MPNVNMCSLVKGNIDDHDKRVCADYALRSYVRVISIYHVLCFMSTYVIK